VVQRCENQNLIAQEALPAAGYRGVHGLEDREWPALAGCGTQEGEWNGRDLDVFDLESSRFDEPLG